jgi:hypothetical protein
VPFFLCASAAAAVAAAIPAVVPVAAAAEQHDQDQDDPQAAIVAPTVIAASHNEYLPIQIQPAFASSLYLMRKEEKGAAQFPIKLQNRWSMAATSARLAVPEGANSPAPVPVMIPAPTAQDMASLAQEETWEASG